MSDDQRHLVGIFGGLLLGAVAAYWLTYGNVLYLKCVGDKPPRVSSRYEWTSVNMLTQVDTTWTCSDEKRKTR
jgi:hypothetical protein